MAKPAAVALVTEVIRCSQGDVAVPNVRNSWIAELDQPSVAFPDLKSICFKLESLKSVAYKDSLLTSPVKSIYYNTVKSNIEIKIIIKSSIPYPILWSDQSNNIILRWYTYTIYLMYYIRKG